MVFYLKYRPKTLDDLDNSQVATLMGKYLTRASVPHAFLFTGPKGTGKTSTARIVAKSLNCTSAKEPRHACGTCDICQSIAKGENLDVIEIDAASNRGIDEIRDLREKIKLAPLHLSYKAYIIDEVHMLTNEAFNALLKTLEEPPAHAVFILATTEPQKVPETIISRCIKIDFHKASHTEIVRSLKRIAKSEGIKADEATLMSIAQASDGSFRDAAKMLEEASLDSTQVTLENVLHQVGLTDPLLLEKCLTHLQDKNARALLELIQTLEKEGKSVRTFFLTLIKKLEELLLTSYTEKGSWDRPELIRAIRLLAEGFSHLKSAVVPAIPFELAMIEYCEGSVSPSVSTPIASVSVAPASPSPDSSVLSLTAKWGSLLEALKSQNHSLVGVLRSCRPLTLQGNELTLEAAYKFHAERLEDPKVQAILTKAVKDVLGLEVKIEVVIKNR